MKEWPLLLAVIIVFSCSNNTSETRNERLVDPAMIVGNWSSLDTSGSAHDITIYLRTYLFATDSFFKNDMLLYGDTSPLLGFECPSLSGQYVINGTSIRFYLDSISNECYGSLYDYYDLELYRLSDMMIEIGNYTYFKN